MRVLIVVEAGLKAGLGHFFRSRALLLELWAGGHSADLWLRGDRSVLSGRAWPDAMALLESDDSESVDAVAAGIGRQLEQTSYDWVVVDGNSFSGAQLHETVTASGARLLMVDDLGNRELKSDVIVNPNTRNRRVYDHDSVIASQFLLGPQFAPIDRAYANLRPRPTDSFARMLISFGGVDRRGRTQRVLELLDDYMPALHIVAVSGPYYPHLDRLKSWRSRHSVTIRQDVTDLSALIKDADFLVSGGGMTAWQACCTGIPMIALQMVENQRLSVETLRQGDAALCLDASGPTGEDAGIPAHGFAALVEKAADISVRRSLSDNAMRLVDGEGASRIAASMAA